MVIAEDTTRLKKIMEQERVFQFLVGLNLELEQVRVYKHWGKNLFHPSGRFVPL